MGVMLFKKDDIYAVQDAASQKSDAIQAAANQRSVQAAAKHRADLISKDLNAAINLFSWDLQTVRSDLDLLSWDSQTVRSDLA